MKSATNNKNVIHFRDCRNQDFFGCFDKFIVILFSSHSLTVVDGYWYEIDFGYGPYTESTETESFALVSTHDIGQQLRMNG